MHTHQHPQPRIYLCAQPTLIQRSRCKVQVVRLSIYLWTLHVFLVVQPHPHLERTLPVFLGETSERNLCFSHKCLLRRRQQFRWTDWDCCNTGSRLTLTSAMIPWSHICTGKEKNMIRMLAERNNKSICVWTHVWVYFSLACGYRTGRTGPILGERWMQHVCEMEKMIQIDAHERQPC